MAAINYLVVVNAFIIDVFFFSAKIEITDVGGATCIVFFTFFSAMLKCFGKTND